MRTYDEIVKDCNALIPRDVIEEREGGAGRKLSYLPGFYVINRLNEVFGQGQWATTSDVTLLHSGVYPDRYGKDVNHVHYSAKVRLVVTVGDRPTEFTDYGYGDGSDKANPGKAHELAIKEAITDGLKRCARLLGNSFGNGLYDRSGDGIEEKEVPKVQTRPAVGPNPNRVEGVPAKPTESVPAPAQSGASSRDAVNKGISQYAKVIIDKKALTQTAVMDMLLAYGVDKKEDLTDEQANELLGKLKGVLK